ncbi:hypothetical protein [Streptomyces sp. 6N223]|uniref:hypothetical protein n=1 Tax=Streptomyces sp. 6N223 TaxID=3457412 RepID=UPI003FCF4435
MSLRLIVSAAFVALAAGVATDPAMAAQEDPGAVEVTPAGPRPGDEVELRVTGCEDAHGVARSAAFVAEATLAPADGAAGGLMGEARVASTVPPGEYPVEVSCDGDEARLTGRISVGGEGGGGGGDDGGGDAGEPAPGSPEFPGSSDAPQEPQEPHEPQEPQEPPQGHDQGQGQGYGRLGEPTPTAPVRAGGGGTAAGGPASAGASLSIGPAGLALLSGALVSSTTLLAVRRRPRRKGGR